MPEQKSSYFRRDFAFTHLSIKTNINQRVIKRCRFCEESWSSTHCIADLNKRYSLLKNNPLKKIVRQQNFFIYR